MLIYVFVNIGIFTILMQLSLKNNKVVFIEDLKGLYKKDPLYAFMLSIFFLSIAGIPPLAGFFGKLFIIYNAISSGYYVLSTTAVIVSLAGMFYYIRIVKYVYSDSETTESTPYKKDSFFSLGNFVIYISFIFIIGFVIFLKPLVSFLSLLHIN